MMRPKKDKLRSARGIALCPGCESVRFPFVDMVRFEMCIPSMDIHPARFQMNTTQFVCHINGFDGATGPSLYLDATILTFGTSCRFCMPPNG